MSSTDPSANPAHSVATEFVTDAFETEVTEDAIRDLATAVEAHVQTLRENIDSDDRLEALLRSHPGGATLVSNDSTENEDPEPLTQRALIKPLLEELGYPELAVEAGDLSEEYGQQADYSVSLRDYDEIDSERLLIEAEPLNKPLDQEAHGIGQVKDWLEKRHFAADFGIATDGVRWVLIKYDADTYSYDTLAEVNLQPLYLAAFENLTGQKVPLDEWLDDATKTIATEFLRSFGWRNFRTIAGEAREVIRERKEAITDEFYDDYVRLVFGEYDDGEETARSLVGDGVIAPESATGDDIRLFSVGLMNRLIFIKFLEDKGLVGETLLQDLVDEYESAGVPQRFYKAYLEPLFFGVLDELPDDRPDHVQQMDIYDDIPYLNGGLFRPSIEGSNGFSDRDFDVRDSVLIAIIDLLERYSFSADGGPTDLDPSVLGNVFEKTINHITTDSADTQKELGAYYTPDEITRFCAEETVQPALKERFADRMVADWGWTEEMAAGYDDVYSLIEALPATNTDVIDDLLDIVDHFRALDPACGSGHFLTSVQSEIVGIRKALYEKHDDDPANWELHKQTVVQNIYGVDIVDPAVEIAKLRLWLSIIAEVDPATVDEYDDDELALPNVVFNVRQGNSLIGYTELMETTGDGAQAQLDAWGPDSVRSKYGNIIAKVERHKQATDTKEAQQYLEEAEDLLSEYREDLDEKVLGDFREAGVEEITLEQVQAFDPFHWVLEFASVYADGGFDVIVGNPPWDQLRPSRDDYFSRYDERFRSRMPADKDATEAELLNNDSIAEGWEEYQTNIDRQMRYFTDGSAYELQTPTVAGRKDPNENNLAALFLERVFSLARDDAYISQILPGVIFSGSFAKDLRTQMLDEANIKALVEFQNRGIFDALHRQFRFGVVVFDNSGYTESLQGIFTQYDLDVLQSLEKVAVNIPRDVLTEYSREGGIFPFVSSQKEVEVLEDILSHPSLGDKIEDTWNVVPHRELDRARAADRFVEDADSGDYPVYGGKNIHQFVYDNSIFEWVDAPALWSVSEDDPENSAKFRIRERSYNSGDLKKAIYNSFGGENTSKSQKQFVNDLLDEHRGKPLSMDDVLPDFTEYRIVYRDITNATNERTMVATVLPKDIACVHTLQTFSPYVIQPEEDNLSDYPLHSAYNRAYSNQELFVIVGLFNSIPFDFLMRTKIERHLVRFKLQESQMPRLTEGDDWFEYIWRRAYQLNTYGSPFDEMRERLDEVEPVTNLEERKRLRTEIDAAAFHAYGLGRDETKFVLDDFHRVQNPRIMTDEYFEMVLEKYDELADEGPME
ncbi:hypothetical protein BVU17_18300 (plasmid) [Haloarcula taiwanensis]|uniref:site-specific DNA-methyltransferase (adenine-specific) n=1 Tax=Haloarcula taiwanensis TaxID=1932004 RepID=A0A2H5A488_9EURY|nr:DNA methyltransferase [Haloarcula taiwanensis]AUG49534.1 hypothetical protein BVU17_18300 [Haloarcula taiwanensis]